MFNRILGFIIIISIIIHLITPQSIRILRSPSRITCGAKRAVKSIHRLINLPDHPERCVCVCGGWILKRSFGSQDLNHALIFTISQALISMPSLGTSSITDSNIVLGEWDWFQILLLELRIIFTHFTFLIFWCLHVQFILSLAFMHTSPWLPMEILERIVKRLSVKVLKF